MVKKSSPALAIRNRVKELRMVKASELIPHEKNWRRHPSFQRSVMQDVLAEIGFAGAIIARDTPEGLIIIDGHLRAEVTGGQDVPVLVLDVDEAEAKKLLATFDPIGALAVTDGQVLNELLEGVVSRNDDLNSLFRTLSEENSFLLSEGESDISPKLDKSQQVIKVAIYFPDLFIFEQALLATGEMSREKALIKICEAYLGQG